MSNLQQSAIDYLVSVKSSRGIEENRFSMQEVYIIESSPNFLRPTMWRENADTFYFQVSIRDTSVVLIDKEYAELVDGKWVFHIDRPCRSFIQTRVISVSKLISESNWHIVDDMAVNDKFVWSNFIKERYDFYSKFPLWESV